MTECTSSPCISEIQKVFRVGAQFWSIIQDGMLMKRLCIILIVLLAAGCKKNTQVPAVVKTAFDHRFAGITVQRWEKEHHIYEAEFEMNGTRMSASFSAEGEWLETETGITPEELPKAAQVYISMHYPAQKIMEAARIINAGNTISYEAEIHGTDLFFDAEGRLITSKTH